MGTSKWTRRRVLAAGSAVAALTLGAPAVRAQGKGRVVFGTWGGSWEAAMRKAWFDPFTAKTGIEVVTASGNTYGKIQSMVESGRPEWDMVEVQPDFQWIGADKGLLEKINFSIVDKSPIMPGKDMVTEYSVPQVLFSRVMFYNTKMSPEAPMNWADVWDLKKYPGKRAFFTRTHGGVLEAALMADGVAPDKLYPLDIDRALKKLAEIKSHILWYDGLAQAEQYMTDGQAQLGLVADGRVLSAIGNKAPVAIQNNQSLLTWSTMVVLKGAKNSEAAMKLLAYALSVEGQTAIALAYTYGPVVPAAFKAIPAERAATLSGGPQQQGKFVLLDAAWWGKNTEVATERLNAWRVS
jgi:putative spermidine/putrescine transport system substrate-binding protein